MGNHPLDFGSAWWIIIQSARLLEEGSTRAICSQLTNKVATIKNMMWQSSWVAINQFFLQMNLTHFLTMF
jgi:hypothetical protein